jgi:hypothetical protein
MLTQLASLARIDFHPRHAQPRMSRVVLAADALLVVPSEPGFTDVELR